MNPEYSLQGLMLKLKLQLWPPDVKNWLPGKDPDAGQEWRQEEKGMTEEMIGWHHRLNGHVFEHALGVGDRQGSLECCSPWGRKQLDTTEWLNWTDTPYLKILVELLLLFVYFISSEVHTKVKNYNEDPRLVLHPNAKHYALPIFSGVTYRASGQ